MTESDVNLIVESLLKPVIDELIKQCSDMDVKSAKILIDLISKLTDRVNSNTLNIYKHISFFKSVLIAHGLTNEEAYSAYLKEWEQLNPGVMKLLQSDTNSDSKS